MLKEFKEFIGRGNVVDLAVGIIIGGAFKSIVSSLVNDIVMPLIGIIIGGVSFSEMNIAIGTAVVNYGLFIQAVVDFLIIAVVIFLMVKGINKFRKKEEEIPAAPPAPSNEEVLLSEIRDLLKK